MSKSNQSPEGNGEAQRDGEPERWSCCGTPIVWGRPAVAWTDYEPCPCKVAAALQSAPTTDERRRS